MLLELGIDIKSLDIWNKTALHIASSYNRFEIIQMLLNKGSDNNKKDSYGKTAWDYANEFIKISLPELKPKNKE
jgi:ankyrin repeat protein